MIRLSARLELAASLVPEDAVVIDVGSDSGQFALFLEEKGHKCYAVENKDGPYKILVGNLVDHGSKVEPIFQDGLSSIPDDADCVTILGMGGQLISRILTDAKKELKLIDYIVVGPQSLFPRTFSALNELGYVNIGGKYIYERHYYPILLFKKGEAHATDDEITYGAYPLQNRDTLLRQHLTETRRTLKEFIDQGYATEKNKREYSQAGRILKDYYGENIEE